MTGSKSLKSNPARTELAPAAAGSAGMTKHERMEAALRGRAACGDLPVAYTAYFDCFNAGEYYEAHDVLEHLWLGCSTPDAGFYKGLIQIAGAFVHLKKQFERPLHPKDGRRLHPAVRLFALGVANVEPFAPSHLGLDVVGLVGTCRLLAEKIRTSHFTQNPWSPDRRPTLILDRQDL